MRWSRPALLVFGAAVFRMAYAAEESMADI